MRTPIKFRKKSRIRKFKPLYFDPESRKLKKEAHRLAEQVFGAWNNEDKYINKNRMYTYLERTTRTGHISTLDKRELKTLIAKLKGML